MIIYELKNYCCLVNFGSEKVFLSQTKENVWWCCCPFFFFKLIILSLRRGNQTNNLKHIQEQKLILERSSSIVYVSNQRWNTEKTTLQWFWNKYANMECVSLRCWLSSYIQSLLNQLSQLSQLSFTIGKTQPRWVYNFFEKAVNCKGMAACCVLWQLWHGVNRDSK